MKVHNSVLEISHNYNGFILDIWGVLHSSGVPFEGVIENLLKLKKQQKQIVLLSNAPRRASTVEAFLKEKVGIKIGKHYDAILTSGEAFYLEMEAKKESGEVFYIGPEKDLDVTKGLLINLTKDLTSKPKFAIITGVVENSLEILHFLKQNHLTLYCLNPDIFITKSDGSREDCAGMIAKKYLEIGGKVVYFGKPYINIYNQVMTFFERTEKSKILAIGDGMETDIEGASKAGISSALCLAGLPSLELKSGIKIEDFIANFQYKPTFIINSL
jgi:HAD superfamily hydrolase (TIGR01459 family)